MADIRSAAGVRIVDFDTNNEADVSAAGNLAVELRLSSATVIVDTELPAAVALADATANPTVPGVSAFGMGFNGTTWDRLRATTANGLSVDVTRVTGTVIVDSELPAAAALADAFANPTAPGVGAFNLGWNGTTWDRLKSTTANGLAVDVTRVTGTVTVDTELPAAAALADATATPTVPGVGAFGMGFNGTTWDRLRTANTGRLQVDVITGGGTDSPTNPAVDLQTSVALAAGSSATLSTADIASKRLWQADITASVPFKAILSTLTNAVATQLTTVFGRAGEVVSWRPPHRSFAISGSSAGLDGFRAVITNLDVSEAADVYASFMYADN